MMTRKQHKGSALVLMAVLMLLVWWASTPAFAGKIKVNSADPAAAPQGADLSVTIDGSQFPDDPEVEFLFGGTQNQGGVTVLSVERVSANRLIAQVAVAGEAELGLFDIEVRSRSGRGKGKGTDLFTVHKEGEQPVPQNVTEFLRIELRDLGTDKVRSDAWTGAGHDVDLLCADSVTPTFQYWLASEDGVDALCQGSADFAHSRPTLTGPTGLWFSTFDHDSTLPSQEQAANRWSVLDFGDVLDGADCPDLDTVLYTDPVEEIAVFYPPINPDPCVDNVEILFRAGVEIFSFNVGDLITDATIEVHQPEWVIQNKKRQRNDYGNASYTLWFDSLVVTQAGDPDRVALGCGTAGHTCNVQLRSEGQHKGYFDMTFEVVIQRVFCSEDGFCFVR